MGRGWGWVAAWVSVLPALGSEPKLTMRFPNALADPAPVQIEVLPSAETRTDYLEWRAHSVVYRLPVPRTPNAPTRREWLCYSLVLQRGWRFQPSFSWREAGTPKPLEGANLPQHVGVVIVGNLSGGYEFLKQVAYTPAPHLSRSQLELNPKNFPLAPLYLRPQELPDHPAALFGIPFIVLAEGAEQLSVAQQRALLLWMHAGGQLILPLSTASTLLKRTAFAHYLPTYESPTLQRLKEPIALQGKRFPPPSQDVPVAFLSHPRSEPIAKVGDRVLAARIHYGYGQMIVFGGDLTHSAWRSWQAHPTLWQTFLQQVRLPLLRLSDVQQLPNLAPPAEPAQRYMQVALPAAVLVAHICALYALWRILRLHRKLVFAPIGVAALSGVGIVALLLVMPPKQVHTSLTGKRVMLCVGDGAVEYSIWRYHSPAGEWRLDWQPVDALAVEPIVALNPVVVEFTSQGACLSGGGIAPTIVNIHTLTQKPAPLRVRKSPRGYELVNTSDELTFAQIYIGRYKSPSCSRPTHETQTQEHLWAWQPLTTSPLAPARSIPLPHAPTEGHVVQAFARKQNATLSEEVEVWLFLP